MEYSLQAVEDLNYWKKTNNNAVLQRIRLLIESITQTPYQGIGKPESLKHNFTGCWSRRINQEHRIVYEVTNNTIFILSLKGHYK
ncbi:Txe/YoeB family addiction module toxin [Dyadobacter psychrotolerans]|uniref:Putative mRNA interferase YoeB n=1 Tax=Dyadobacter psychrotolerans TaxID=2541721 RepID=A0A4R5DHU5_9BACT|nr:Txe/YoeB family addiction module toxin [Dyadobacter psychrotolerans]TDE10073.1 Txe/YoeB family addiction module toxin [Dyadobacter psychrotolerans]